MSLKAFKEEHFEKGLPEQKTTEGLDTLRLGRKGKKKSLLEY